MTDEVRSLATLDAASQMLASCTDIEDVRLIRDQALAVQTYARAQRLSGQLQARAAGIRIDAEVRIGELLMESVPREGRPGKFEVRPTNFSTEERARFRALSRVPAEHREAIKATLGPDATPSGLLRLARGQAKSERAAQVFATAVRGPDIVASLDELISCGARYGTVYADPPWAYRNQGTRSATNREYVTMSVDAIAALPVRDVVLEQAHLHLWTTNAFLFDAKRVMESWGFEYKSCFVWVKPKIGIGNYWRVSHEFLLFGTRGGLTFRDRDLRSWAEFPAREHSAKPEAVRTMVEKASPGPYLEMFGRASVAGDWTVLGNDVGPRQERLEAEMEVSL